MLVDKRRFEAFQWSSYPPVKPAAQRQQFRKYFFMCAAPCLLHTPEIIPNKDSVCK